MSQRLELKKVREMVKVIYAPWKEIVIHEFVEHNLDDFLKLRCIGITSGALGKPLLWIDGIALDRIGMRETESVIREKLEGKLHWSSLSFATMPKYKPMITVREGNIRIPIIDVSDNSYFQAVVKWLKVNIKK